MPSRVPTQREAKLVTEPSLRTANFSGLRDSAHRLRRVSRWDRGEARHMHDGHVENTSESQTNRGCNEHSDSEKVCNRQEELLRHLCSGASATTIS